MPGTQCLHRRLDKEIGRAEIRLPDPEIDDVAALGGEMRRARKHGEGIFLTDAVESGNRLQHDHLLANCEWRVANGAIRYSLFAIHLLSWPGAPSPSPPPL